MTMGYGSNFALVIEQEKIEAFNLSSYQEFIQALEKANVSLEEYGRSTESEDCIYDNNGDALDEDTMESLDAIYKSFQDEFKEKTGVGIAIRYHDSGNSGDCYDEVDGVFFGLEFSDVYKMTPEAKELQDKTGFDLKFFVTFG